MPSGRWKRLRPLFFGAEMVEGLMWDLGSIGVPLRGFKCGDWGSTLPAKSFQAQWKERDMAALMQNEEDPNSEGRSVWPC